MILCGDIGGTKTLLALAEVVDGVPAFRFRHRYACADYTGFSPMLGDFFHAAQSQFAGFHPAMIASGCLAVAGPVETNGKDGINGKRARLTNLPWSIDADAIAATTGCGPLRLVNDFAAAATGIDAVAPDEFVTLQTGEPLAHAPRLVVGAGTGLGVAALIRQEGREVRVLPGEGGHCGFAPANAEQDALLDFLRARAPEGRVTAERVISGPGLLAIYEFLCSRHPADRPDPRDADDPAAALSELAAQHSDSLARRAVDLFCTAYGAFAGDMALTFMARGGVYIAGGIAAHLLPLLRSGPFLDAFNAKAEHRELAARMAVHVVTDPDLGLKGAALLAG